MAGLFVFYAFAFNVFGQNTTDVRIDFKHIYGEHSTLNANTTYLSADGQAVKFETLKYYISNVLLLNDGKPVWSEMNSYHVLDAFDSSKSVIHLSVSKGLKFNKIKFDLGVDSLTNVSGAMGGDLDPTMGMYWAWQSGYINFKLEGTSSACSNPRKEFQYHLGGYLAPFNSLQSIVLNVKEVERIVIDFDLSKFLEAIDLAKKDHIMSPSYEAVILSEAAAKSFNIQ